MFIIFWLGFNPLMGVMDYALVDPEPGTRAYTYFPVSPHTWFLLWLLVFQMGYATLSGPNLVMEVPTFHFLACEASKLAVIQLIALIMCVVVGSPSGFAEMPMVGPGGDGFFNVFAFAFGVIAKRNQWLEKPLPKELLASCWKYVGILLAIVSIIFFIFFSPVVFPDVDFNMGFAGLILIILNIPCGPLCFSLIVIAIDFFQRNMDFESGVSKFLAGGAFVVYLIHYYLLQVFIYLFIQIQDETFIFNQTDTTKSALMSTNELNEGQKWSGFLFVFFCAVTTGFIFGGLLKMVPGISNFI